MRFTDIGIYAMKLGNCLLVVWFLALSTNAFAGEKNGDSANPVLALAAFEGLIAVNAWMASKNPQVYGGAAALLFPFAAAETKRPTTFWVSLAAAEALAIYNINLDDDQYSEGEIFKNNMLGWHLFAGAVGLSVWLSDEDEINSNVSLAFLPAEDGGQVVLAYRF